MQNGQCVYHSQRKLFWFTNGKHLLGSAVKQRKLKNQTVVDAVSLLPPCGQIWLTKTDQYNLNCLLASFAVKFASYGVIWAGCPRLQRRDYAGLGLRHTGTDWCSRVLIRTRRKQCQEQPKPRTKGTLFLVFFFLFFLRHYLLLLLTSVFLYCVLTDFNCILYFSTLDYYEDPEDDRGDDDEVVFSEDEAVTQRGIRRSQSTKVSRTRLRKDVRVF